MENKKHRFMSAMKNSFNKIFIVLIGLGFFGFGAYFLSDTSIPTFRDWTKMKPWYPVNARLIHVGGAENHTKATYQYQVKDKIYTGNRVYIATFNDSIGSYHEKMQAKLKRALKAGQAITIYIHPLDPQQSVIDREMRWGLFSLMTGFCLVFIIIGIGLAFSGLSHTPEPAIPMPSTTELRKEWEEKKKDPAYTEDFFDYLKFRKHEIKQQAKDQPPNQPGEWQNKQEWKTRAIRSDAKSNFTSMWFFAIICLAVSSPILFMFKEEWQSGNYAILIGLIFPLIGLFLTVKAVTQTKEYLKFGIIEYVMDPYPGSVGGQIGGWMDLKRNYDFNADYQVELECIFSYISGTGEDKTRRETIKWAQKGTAQKDYANNRLRISFVFDIPDDLPESAIEQEEDYYFWRLSLKAKMPGVDLNRTYNIPVMKTKESSQITGVNISKQVKADREKISKETKDHLTQGKYELTELSQTAVVSDTPLKLEIYFPMFNNKVLTIFTLVFGACFSGLSYGLISTINKWGIFEIIMGIIAFPFSILALFCIIATFYLLFHNLKVTFIGQTVNIRHRLFLIPVWYQSFAYQDIQSMSVKRTGSTGQGTSKVEHYRIYAETRQGKRFTIARDINGKETADHVKDWLYQKTLSG